MIRTQITLTQKQKKELETLAAREGKSMAELVRISIDQYLKNLRITEPQEIKSRAIRAAGSLIGGPSDLSSDHDRYLSESIE